MADTSIDVANMALARLGEPSISSFLDTTDAAEKAGLFYEETVRRILSMKNWHFATTRVSLEVDASATEPSGWARGFLMPALNTDRVGNPLAFYITADAGALKISRFQIKERWVYTNTTSCACEYVKRKPENLWPSYFTELVAEALAAKLALPITENQSKEEYHQSLAFGTLAQKGRGGMFSVAEQADDAGTPMSGLLDDDDPIGDVRFGGWR